jgi:hypothetical protein
MAHLLIAVLVKDAYPDRWLHSSFSLLPKRVSSYNKLRSAASISYSHVCIHAAVICTGYLISYATDWCCCCCCAATG